MVIATRNRRDTLLDTLHRLAALGERPPVCVVDNASSDDTVASVRHAFPGVHVIALQRNAGAAARNVGAAALDTPLIAFNDDDSWWAPGALARAARTFEEHPRLALLAARVLVGAEQRLDPVCTAMASSPVPSRDGLPGPAVLGFIACGAVVRRDAFLAVGGFEERFGVGGEEQLLAVDLAAAGWDLAYVPAVQTHHVPAHEPRAGRPQRQLRNEYWSAWLRRPAPAALRETARLLRRREPASLAAFGEAARGLPWVLRSRRVVPPAVERSIASLG